MSADNFQACLAFVLKSEGGNDDDPQDHGGRTSRGITQREYDAWSKEQGWPPSDVWKASAHDIAQIYHDEYWMPLCDDLPIGIDYLYFDMAVNAGPHRAAVLLQKALGVNPDGRIGAVSRQAIRNCDAKGLIEKFSTAKANWYKSLHQPRFTQGWLNRTASVKINALSMLKGPQT
jgi:lysozyme family protein